MWVKNYHLLLTKPVAVNTGWRHCAVRDKRLIYSTCHFARSVKSPFLCSRLTDFGKIWHNLAPYSAAAVEFRIFANPRWRRPPSSKSQKSRNGLTDRYEIWYGDAKWVSQPLRPLQNLNFKNPRWRMAASCKTVNSPYLCDRLTDFDAIWHGHSHWFPASDVKLNF